MVGQTPKDAPFGLDANVAAGLAYLFGFIGGIVMLFGGGTNKFVKWAAAQSLTLGITFIALYIIFRIILMVLPLMGLLLALPFLIIELAYLVVYLLAAINAFQGKEMRLPMIAAWTEQLFGSLLA
jgi:uncharacterized membrane protein